MTSLEQVLRDAGLDPLPVFDDDDSVFDILVEFRYGTLQLAFDGRAGTDDDGRLVVIVAVPVVDVDLDRLAQTTLVAPVQDVDVIWADDTDSVTGGEHGEPGDAGEAGEAGDAELDLVTFEASAADGASLDVVGPLIEAISALVGSLTSDGVIRLSDATDDADVAEIMRSIEAQKAVDARGAIGRALDGVQISRAIGDEFVASMLELCAAEVLLELGDISRAHVLAEPAWRRLGEALDQSEFLTVVATARSKSGYLAEAVELMIAGIEAATTPADAGRLAGNLGVIFAYHSKRPEAIDWLRRALESSDLAPPDRAVFTAQLAEVRRFGVVADAAADPERVGGLDAIDDANAALNEVASLLHSMERREVARHRTRIEQLLSEVEANRAGLGIAQQARVAHARSALAIAVSDMHAARRLMETAIELASTSGDTVYVASLMAQAGSLGWSAEVPLGPEHGVLDRIAFLTNSALVAMPGLLGPTGADVAARGLAQLEQALELVDNERHRYRAMADRSSWLTFSARVYELALVHAHAVRDRILVLEILERARGQGIPLALEGVNAIDASSALIGAPQEPIGSGLDTTERLLGGVRQALGDLAVGPPIIASPRTVDPSHTGSSVQRVPMAAVVHSIAGGPAWWWSCHVFADRLHWGLRDPEGAIDTGVELIAGGFGALAALVTPFTERYTASTADLHPLAGDRDDRRDPLLAQLARVLLPPRLRQVIADAARSSSPIDLVWAPPKELAVLPLTLLPVGEHVCLIEGARVVLAPPTSLVTSAAAEQPPLLSSRPVIAILGSDPDLTKLDRLVGSSGLGLPESSVLGAPHHVRSGLAARLATPENVVAAAAANPASVAVYYGHIVQTSANLLSVAMSLTDGRSRAVLSAADLLQRDRRGAPHIVVLAGCSSLSATGAGSGEWWGISTGMLWQGSEHVAGSMWDLPNRPATMDFVVELTDALRSGSRPHHALHALQLRSFRRWRANGDRGVATDADEPYQWAGWSMVSATPTGAPVGGHR